MKILYCDPLRSGSLHDVYAREISRNLKEVGHEVIPLYPEGRIVRHTDGRAGGSRRSVVTRLKQALKSMPLYGLLKGEILVFWLIWKEVGVFVRVIAAAVRHRGEIDAIYRAHNLLNSEYLVGRLFGIASVQAVHGIVADEARIASMGDRVSLWLLERMEKCNMPRADRTVVVTSKLRDVLVHDYHVEAGRIAVVWNGANVDLFKPMDVSQARTKLGLEHGHDYLCYVGSLSPWQGVDGLIRALPAVAAERPNVRLLIVGDGTMRAALVALADQAGVGNRVIFTGLVPYEQVPLYVNASDICVAPFVATRNQRIGLSPLKLCEYMACAKPVVASAIEGLEIIETSGGGLLVPPGDLQALAGALARLCHNPGLRSQMGDNGRQYVLQNRTWRHAARKVAEVCQEASEQRRGGRGIRESRDP